VVERKGGGIDKTCGLTADALELIRSVFRRHPEVHAVKLFGSRATGRFEDGSDVDLALWGDVNPHLLGRIAQELDELPLPYTFDVKTYEAIGHESLRCRIDQTGKTLYAC